MGRKAMWVRVPPPKSIRWNGQLLEASGFLGEDLIGRPFFGTERMCFVAFLSLSNAVADSMERFYCDGRVKSMRFTVWVRYDPAHSRIQVCENGAPIPLTT